MGTWPLYRHDAMVLVMEAARQSSVPEPAERSEDQCIILHHVGWDTYDCLLEARGDNSTVRITYLKGALEFMSPSLEHESDKTLLARLVEAYAEEVGVELVGAGSWTIRNRLKEAGAEPDECYFLGVPEKQPSRPDLVIEVVRTSGGISKLEVYQRLGIPEIWFWEKRRLQIYVLHNDAFQRVTQSRLLPGLDIALLERFMSERAQTQAVRFFRQELRKRF